MEFILSKGIKLVGSITLRIIGLFRFPYEATLMNLFSKIFVLYIYIHMYMYYVHIYAYYTYILCIYMYNSNLIENGS